MREEITGVLSNLGAVSVDILPFGLWPHGHISTETAPRLDNNPCYLHTHGLTTI